MQVPEDVEMPAKRLDDHAREAAGVLLQRWLV
jgi:hypothetical protein